MRGTRRGLGGHARMTETRIRASEGSTWSGPTPQSQPSRWTRRVEQSSSSDDSTQPPEMVLGTEFPEISNAPNTSLENNGKLPMRRCRGPAGCTEFMKLRKHGLIPLKINDGERAPSCENAVFFTTRVTWIIKHHATMVQNTWDVVDTQEKEELINRVRADFILDWSKRNHREMVEKNLGKKFNDFHYQLHKIYLGCATHDEALVKSTSLVEPDVWKILCGRWGSDEFKKISNQNKANRKRQSVNHTPGRKSFMRLIQEMNTMIEKLHEMEPEKRTDEAANIIFRDVLGHRSGYARGLGGSVIPEPRPSSMSAQVEHLAQENDKHKNEAMMYKTELDDLKREVRQLLIWQQSYDQRMNLPDSDFESV
ncbi:uncharacterized protein LOC121234974 isoform X3 [Juglans microcarpa x Juglans regia]|uniref:uncharacterized protein LOC121234974 isoform X3 n=1 Tax=Juglans microcarpa x Juglans regia TaxID=2249226 RepID=UPI001B7DA98E|nr:uncharacterized protein LOC121234974 isoform X3 [Juglans microcarpa x Juglans regia]